MASGNDNMQFPSGSHDPFDRIPVEINEMILAHLPIADLLLCGLVNKTWKNRSRSYLQSHRECYAYVKNPGKDLLALNNHMSRSNLNMINGINIRNENPDKWKDIDVVDCCQVLMQFPWKYLHVIMPLDYESKCDVKLVRSLIWASRLSVTKLSLYLEWMQTTFFDFILAAGEENAFPNLTTFECLGIEFSRYSNWYEVLPWMAPRLKDILGVAPIGPMNTWDVSLVKCIREVSMEAANCSTIERCNTSASAEQFAQILASHLSNLRVLKLDCYDHPIADLRPSMQLQLDILHNNRNTLEELKICGFYLLQYRRRYPTERFPKLKTVCITDYIEYSPNVRGGIFKHLNDSTYFPNVTELAVDFGYDEWPEEIFLELLVEENLSFNETPLVLKIIAYDDEFHELSGLETCFQRVSTIRVCCISNLGEGNFFHLASTFIGCPLLEELDIVLHNNEDGYRDCDVDALLCGIHIEEAASILEQHRNGILHLEDLNIVPIRPAISCSRNLKRLRLHENYFRSDVNTQRISEVSGYLAFRRMPQVEVRIEGYVSNRRALVNLAPFACVTYGMD